MMDQSLRTLENLTFTQFTARVHFILQWPQELSLALENRTFPKLCAGYIFHPNLPLLLTTNLFIIHRHYRVLI